MDKLLTRLLLLLSAFLAVIHVVDEMLIYRTMSGMTKGDGQCLLGRTLRSLFSRVPIVPDRLMFYSNSPGEMSLEYDAMRAGFKKFPGLHVVCFDGIVIDVTRK